MVKIKCIHERSAIWFSMGQKAIYSLCLLWALPLVATLKNWGESFQEQAILSVNQNILQ